MALNQKYTWADFLKAHPEHKEKPLKRTSDEGKKLFEAAFKKHIKEYLKERSTKIEKQAKRATTERTALVKQVQEIAKTKNWVKFHTAQTKVGKKDAHLARLKKQEERLKVLSKSF